MRTKQPLETLIQSVSRLPGLGPRSAKRLVLYLLENKTTVLEPLMESLERVKNSMSTCDLCHGLDTHNPCYICKDDARQGQLCIVENISDQWALERTHFYRGQYHILGGTLSAIKNKGPEELTLHSLHQRLKISRPQEIIFALSPTMEGQTTTHFLLDELAAYNIPMSQLAQGLPVGSNLDYLDDGTLGLALQSRKSF